MKASTRRGMIALAITAALLMCLFLGMADAYAEVSAVLTEKMPQGVNDLDGWTFTLDRGGRYVTSNVLYNVGDPFRLGKSNNAGDAAVWLFEDAGEGYGYKFYHISTVVNGEKRYLHFWPVWYNNSMAHTTLQTPENSDAAGQGCPQDIAVVRNNDGTYTFFIAIPQYNYARFYLNEWFGPNGNGFAGYNTENNDDHLNVTFLTSQPALENSGNYAVIVKNEANDKYYAVQYDGSLVEVRYDESTGKARVILEEPLTWAYTSVHDGLSDDTLGYNQNDDHPDWEPFNVRAPYDARGFSPVTQLKEGDYYGYLSPGTDEGIARENSENPSHGAFKWENSIRYEKYHVHGIVWNGSGFDDTGKYIGADFDSLHVRGNVGAADAAIIFFAEIEHVPGPSSNGETVTHIDIGIIGKSELDFPLAYGRYYDENGKEILEVTPENDVTLELKKDIDVTRDDIMNAGLTAYDKDGNELDDAYYISGYSANEHTTHSAVQVRMEGSFKVSTLDPYTGSVRSNDDAARRSERLANQVHYEISLTKDVTFDLVHDGQQLYDMHGNKLTVSRPMDITVRFGYWDDNNECPVVQDDFEDKYPALFAGQRNVRAGRNNENWKAGAIIDNDYSSYWDYGDYPYYIGDSGMDFIVTVVAEMERSLAIEIKKSIVDPDGNIIHPAGDVKNTFSLYYNKNADKETVAGVGSGYAVPPNEVDDPGEKQKGYERLLSGIPITVGKDGAYIYYNYEIEPGMYYVEEDSGPMAEGGSNYFITDTDGQVWVYRETKVETEYVWRNDSYTGRRHVANGFSGVPDVLGDYEFEGWEAANNNLMPRNGFLEFYVNNVYEKVEKMQLVIRKEWKGDRKENRPRSIQVIVAAKDDPSMEPYTVTLSEKNNWTYKKTVEPREYYVQEIQVPGYSSSVSSREDPDGTLVITVTNKFIPQTGDDSRVGLWLAMALAGCAVLGGLAAAAWRRKKK